MLAQGRGRRVVSQKSAPNDPCTCLGLLVSTRPCTNFLKLKSKDVFCIIISLKVSLHAVIATCFK